MTNIEEMLKPATNRCMWQDDAVYIRPHIPAKKIAGAKSAYLPAKILPDDIILLMDDTVFGSGKAGLVLTEHGIYLRESFCDAAYFTYGEIKTIANDTMLLNKNLYINGMKVITLVQPENNSIKELVQLIQNYIQPNKIDKPRYTGNQNRNQQDDSALSLDLLFAGLNPLIDIFAHFALIQHDGRWTSESVQWVKGLFNDLLTTPEQIALLQERLKFKNRPPLDQAIKDAVEMADAAGGEEGENIKTFMLIGISEIFEHSGMESMEIFTAGILLSKKIKLNEDTASEILAGYFYGSQTGDYDDTLHKTTTCSPINEHVEWACTILEIAPHQITRETVQQAYRSKIKEFHPDQYQSLPESIQKMLNEKAQDLNKAKEVLSKCYGYGSAQ